MTTNETAAPIFTQPTRVTGDDEIDRLLAELEQVTRALEQRREMVGNLTARILEYRNLRWLSERLSEKMRTVYEFAPYRRDLPVREGDELASKINLTEFSAKVGSSFVLNFSADNKRSIAEQDVQRLFRRAARLYHTDVAEGADQEDNAMKFRLAQSLRDSGDAEGLALLCLYGGLKLDYDYIDLLRKRITAARRYEESLEHSAGFIVAQRVAIGWDVYDAGLYGYVKALTILGDSGLLPAYTATFGPVEDDYGPEAAAKYRI